MSKKHIEDCVRTSLESYLQDLRGEEPDGGPLPGRADRRQLRPSHDEHLARLVHEGDAGRVVAAVLEAPEALDQDGASLAGTRVADDSAHVVWKSPLRTRLAAGRLV